MSKPINLLSLVQAKANLSDATFENFKSHHDLEFRSGEIDDLSSLIQNLIDCGCSITDLDSYVVGYKIPQIGKEFDLLRFGSEYIINIELKRTSDEERIKKQLTKNKYYLSFAGLESYHYTYLSESGLLFKLCDSGEIEKIEIAELTTLLKEQVLSHEQNLDDFFNPASYLVSPFNSTKKFLAGEYFLTHQQEKVSDVIYGHLVENSESGFISLTGGAGTGKTLLAYHVAKTALEAGKRVLVIHCGTLNFGHHRLITAGWNVVQIRDYRTRNISDYDLVVIDEAQRMYISQFENIAHEVISNNKLCIFSFHKLQTLHTKEDALDIKSRLSALNLVSSHRLSEKIRTNKEIADFTNMLFNKNRNIEIKGSKNIHIKYFSTYEDANAYINSLNKSEWKLLKFTPSRFDAEHHEKYFNHDTQTSHSIIGQEFDNVTVVIDEMFSYHSSGQLVYKKSSYYHPRKMLFQNITRARKKLLIIIINNEELLERCMQIL